MKKKYIFILAIMIASVSGIKAQTELTSFQYSMGFTNGDFKDFIERTSYRGVSFDYRKLLNDAHVGVGMDISWNVFDEKMNYASYTDGTSTLSGVQFRYVGALPILAMADYYFKPGEDLNPFIGVGVGTVYTHNDVDMGLYVAQRDAWHFAVKPEAGLILKVNPEMGIMLVAKYFNAFSTDDVAARNYLTVNVGLAWGF
jgi:opacity protein-like surface antigen